MKLSTVKSFLKEAEGVNFQLPDGTYVPEHFHVTEVGIITRHFIDCGGTVRLEQTANFQLWDANDYEHRLKPGKLLHIITLSEQTLGMKDLEVEVEYQNGTTIGKYGIGINGKDFLLLPTKTACLANDQCGIPVIKQKINITELAAGTGCTPGGGCC
jgi:hypothetical protein